jgi:hypothetical protein
MGRELARGKKGKKRRGRDAYKVGRRRRYGEERVKIIIKEGVVEEGYLLD